MCELAALTPWAAAPMVLHVLGAMRLVAEETRGLLKRAHQVVRFEIARLGAQHVLPLASFVVARASHAQLPHHRLNEGL